MKTLQFLVPLILLWQPSYSQTNLAKSTNSIAGVNKQISAQELQENDYISETDFEKIMNEAEATFKKPKDKNNSRSFMEISVGLISKHVRESIKFSNFIYKYPDKAIKLLDKEIELNKSNFNAYDSRARAYREKCSGFNPDPRFNSHPERKTYCEKSLKDFDKVIELAKDDSMSSGYTPIKSEAYRQKGMLYEKIGENEKALEAYNMALKLVKKPEDGNFIYHSRAGLLITMGKYEEAVKDVRSFLNAKVEKFSKKDLSFDPCQKLLEKGYEVEGCPDKELLKKLDYQAYHRIISKERKDYYAEKKKEGGD